MKILWATNTCLLDQTSGASMSVYAILKGLSSIGWEVGIVGATIFDNATGLDSVPDLKRVIETIDDSYVNVIHDGFTHHLTVTSSTDRNKMTLEESKLFYQLYCTKLENFQPDVVFFYGGGILEIHIPREARFRNIPSVAYLVNANYFGKSWCKDVSLIVTDTLATKHMYEQREGYSLTPIGKFIDPQKTVSTTNQREVRDRVLMVNPAPQKGGAFFAAIAIAMREKRPQITFEVVESRTSWESVILPVLCSMNKTSLYPLPNVCVTPHQRDMRPVYGRAKILLHPSLWWESGARTIVEAMMNDIPVIASKSGGTMELLGKAGIYIDIDAIYLEEPYDKVPDPSLMNGIVDYIIRLFDDESFYLSKVEKIKVESRKFILDNNINEFSKILTNLIQNRTH